MTRLSIEVITMIGAALILAVLGGIAFHDLIMIDTGGYFPHNEKPEVIRVIAKQYVWEFIYPNGTVSYDKVVIQAGKPYIFNLTSADVIHAMYIVQLGYKLEAIPGYYYPLYIIVNKPGVYNIYCAEFCGPGHYTMIGELIVVNSTAG
ncbi:cytochrome c oxidase subunit II [Sulfurisphaera ohwakuensis]|uniref:Cytochrome aa3-600 menaquinol oxidase subunit 2 n=1 Tax=Sulfurisphaera ohwakuensis TaxID=69656 RepID=A0A650CKD8_SULOH|nr:cytochrome c oxidase subunit II [Sulfurisphaera ohwakuensis]MBB5253676.1 cytochrome aa3-600 menaquinol oxidase subunit 2 [Sulfurisphaera ohwakuensis]QGR18341.1 cytochrome c oxidase subunit II [Sulfurisphaera ohwakuensis]